MDVAILTGASAGIGRELALALDRAERYDQIWVVARREERLAELAGLCRNPIRPLALDLARPEGWQAVEALLRAERPRVRLLVNAAGCGFFGPFGESDLDRQLTSIRLNVEALTALCRLCLPYMQAGDGIINLGSNSAWQPVPWQAVYGAGKSYVLSFSRALGRELRPKNVRVMCVCPGWIKTEFQSVAEHDRYIRYVDRWYTPRAVAEQTLKDWRKGKRVSILGAPVRRQVHLVKLLPAELVMDIWCRQQGIE